MKEISMSAKTVFFTLLCAFHSLSLHATDFSEQDNDTFLINSPEKETVYRVHITLNPYNAMLWQGIKSSTPSMVRKAIKRGASLSTREMHYADTPLIAAIREYGHSLENTWSNHGKKKGMTASFVSSAFTLVQIVAGTAIVYAVTSGIIASPTWDQQKTILKNGALVTAILYTATLLKNARASQTEKAALIAHLLMSVTEDLDERNEEWLAARDVLHAYYPLAQELHDENWERLNNLLLSLHNKNSI
jgi:hypothetical protein